MFDFVLRDRKMESLISKIALQKVELVIFLLYGVRNNKPQKEEKRENDEGSAI